MKGFTERRPVRTQHLPVWGKQGAFRIAPHILHGERRLSEEGGDGYGQCRRHGRQKDEPVVPGPGMASGASGAGSATPLMLISQLVPFGRQQLKIVDVAANLAIAVGAVGNASGRIFSGSATTPTPSTWVRGSASWRLGACWRRNGPWLRSWPSWRKSRGV